MRFESKTETARKAIMDLLEAAVICLTHEKMLPGVCLVLIAIDTMAALSRPAGTTHVTRRHFGWGFVTASGMQAAADNSLRAGRVVGVQLEQLLQAVQNATLRFGLAVNLDLELEDLVAERSRTMFACFTSEATSKVRTAKQQEQEQD